MRSVSPPSAVTSSSLTILMTCCAGVRLFERSAPEALLADPRDDGAHDREVDVGLEQGHADLAQHLVDVAVAESPLAPEPFEDAVETVGEGVEHAVSQATGAVEQPLGDDDLVVHRHDAGHRGDDTLEIGAASGVRGLARQDDSALKHRDRGLREMPGAGRVRELVAHTGGEVGVGHPPSHEAVTGAVAARIRSPA